MLDSPSTGDPNARVGREPQTTAPLPERSQEAGSSVAGVAEHSLQDQNLQERTDLQDRDLMRRIEQQDQSALAQLYERYGRPVYSLTYRVLQNTALAEEATQDTFMKVWKQSARWDSDKGVLTSWLLTIARYTAIDRLRQEQRQTAPQMVSIDAIVAPESEEGQPEDIILRDGVVLRHLLTQIPQEQAQVIEMGFFQGLTHTELAERLDQPLGTIKTRARLGLQKLRALWNELENQNAG